MKKESIREGRACRDRMIRPRQAWPSRRDQLERPRQAWLSRAWRTRGSASLPQSARPIAICQPVAREIWRPLAAKLESAPNVILKTAVTKLESGMCEVNQPTADELKSAA